MNRNFAYLLTIPGLEELHDACCAIEVAHSECTYSVDEFYRRYYQAGRWILRVCFDLGRGDTEYHEFWTENILRRCFYEPADRVLAIRSLHDTIARLLISLGCLAAMPRFREDRIRDKRGPFMACDSYVPHERFIAHIHESMESRFSTCDTVKKHTESRFSTCVPTANPTICAPAISRGPPLPEAHLSLQELIDILNKLYSLRSFSVASEVVPPSGVKTMLTNVSSPVSTV